jgi:hypothetical protein
MNKVGIFCHAARHTSLYLLSGLRCTASDDLLGIVKRVFAWQPTNIKKYVLLHGKIFRLYSLYPAGIQLS